MVGVAWELVREMGLEVVELEREMGLEVVERDWERERV